VVSAVITAGSDTTPRTVTVTARSGTIARSATFQVAQDGGNIQATAMTLELSASQVNNTGGETVTATVTAVDANRNAMAGVPVRFSIDSNGIIAPTSLVTDSQGRITAVARIGADRSNRTIRITARSAGLPDATGIFNVVGARLNATLVPAIAVAGSTGNKIQYRLLDNNSNPMARQAITVVTPSGAVVQDVTGPNGDYELTYVAPAAAGSYTFQATAAGANRDDVVQVGSASVNAAVGPIQSATVSVSSSVVSVNTTGTNNQVAVRALFVGDNNRPIENVRVRFDTAGDTNNLGGTFNVGSNIVYSNADGVATASFIAGPRPGPTNGLTVRACYSLDSDPVACTTFAVTTLTVTSEAISVSIGTDEVIQLGTGTYIKDFVVMVVDAAGVAKSDIVITPSVDLTAYYKGFWGLRGSRWERAFQSVRDPLNDNDNNVGLLTLNSAQGYAVNGAGTGWIQVGSPLTTGIGVVFPDGTVRQPACPNEDINRNGVRDGVSGLNGEDYNSSDALEPRKADVSVRTVGNNRTAANGTVIVRLEYPRNLATWVDFVVTVQAAGVSGTEGRARYVGWLYGNGNLPAPADAFNNSEVSPAFLRSPYGVSNTCLDDR
jgi:hypothetical protein